MKNDNTIPPTTKEGKYQDVDKKKEQKISYPHSQALVEMLYPESSYPAPSTDLFQNGKTHSQLISEAVNAFREGTKMSTFGMKVIDLMPILRAFMYSPIYQAVFSFPVKEGKLFISENSSMTNQAYTTRRRLVVSKNVSADVKTESLTESDHVCPIQSEFRGIQHKSKIAHIELLLTFFGLADQWKTQTLKRIQVWKDSVVEFHKEVQLYAYLLTTERVSTELNRLDAEGILPRLLKLSAQIEGALNFLKQTDKIVDLEQKDNISVNHEETIKLEKELQEFLRSNGPLSAYLKGKKLDSESAAQIDMAKAYYSKIQYCIQIIKDSIVELRQIEEARNAAHQAEHRMITAADDLQHLSYFKGIFDILSQNTSAYLQNTNALLAAAGFGKVVHLKLNKIPSYQKSQLEQKTDKRSQSVGNLLTYYQEDSLKLLALAAAIERIFIPLQGLLSFIEQESDLNSLDSIVQSRETTTSSVVLEFKVNNNLNTQSKFLSTIMKYLCHIKFRPYLNELIEGNNITAAMLNKELRAILVSLTKHLAGQYQSKQESKQENPIGLVEFLKENNIIKQDVSQNEGLVALVEEVNQVISSSAKFLFTVVNRMKDYDITPQDADFFPLISAPTLISEKDYFHSLKTAYPALLHFLPPQKNEDGYLYPNFRAEDTRYLFTLDWLDEQVQISGQNGFTNPYLPAINNLNRAQWELGVCLTYLWDKHLKDPRLNSKDRAISSEIYSELKSDIEELMGKQASFYIHLLHLQLLIKDTLDFMGNLEVPMANLKRKEKLSSEQSELLPKIEGYLGEKDLLKLVYSFLTNKVNKAEKYLSWLDTNKFRAEANDWRNAQKAIQKEIGATQTEEAELLTQKLKEYFTVEKPQLRVTSSSATPNKITKSETRESTPPSRSSERSGSIHSEGILENENENENENEIDVVDRSKIETKEAPKSRKKIIIKTQSHTNLMGNLSLQEDSSLHAPPMTDVPDAPPMFDCAPPPPRSLNGTNTTKILVDQKQIEKNEEPDEEPDEESDDENSQSTKSTGNSLLDEIKKVTLKKIPSTETDDQKSKSKKLPNESVPMDMMTALRVRVEQRRKAMTGKQSVDLNKQKLEPAKTDQTLGLVQDQKTNSSNGTTQPISTSSSSSSSSSTMGTSTLNTTPLRTNSVFSSSSSSSSSSFSLSSSSNSFSSPNSSFPLNANDNKPSPGKSLPGPIRKPTNTTPLHGLGGGTPLSTLTVTGGGRGRGRGRDIVTLQPASNTTTTFQTS